MLNSLKRVVLRRTGVPVRMSDEACNIVLNEQNEH